MSVTEAEFALSLHSETVSDQGTVELTIHNFSQVSQLYHVHAHHPGDLLQFMPESQYVPVDSHEEEQVLIWVQLSDRQWHKPQTWWSTRKYAFEIIVTADDSRRTEQAYFLAAPPVNLALLAIAILLLFGCLITTSLYTLNNRLANDRMLMTDMLTSQATSSIGVTDTPGDDTAAVDTPRDPSAPTPVTTPTLTPIPTPTPLPEPEPAATLLPTVEQPPLLVTVIVDERPAGEVIVLNDRIYLAHEDRSLTVSAEDGVLANDNASNTGQLRVTDFSQPTYGTVTVNNDGSFIYSPQPSYFGSDTFTYMACTLTQICAAGSVTITVHSRLLAVDANLTFDEDEGVRDITTDMLRNDGDKENTPLTIIAIHNADPVRVNYFSHRGTVQYDPGDHFIYLGEGETATDTFSYTIRNGHQLTSTATITITINGKNNPPQANDNQFTLRADELSRSLSSDMLANDSDPDISDRPHLTIHTITNSESGGTASWIDGEVRYDPRGMYDTLSPGQTATDTFTYTIVDPHGAVSNQATVQITIRGVNDPPHLSVTNLSSPVPFSTTVSSSVGIAEAVEIIDPDSDNMSRLRIAFEGNNPRPDGPEEYLQITFQGNVITSTTNDLISILTVPVPIQEYVAALQTVTYVNNKTEPTAVCRQISFQVFDEGNLESNIETVYIQVNNAVCPAAAQVSALVPTAWRLGQQVNPAGPTETKDWLW